MGALPFAGEAFLDDTKVGWAKPSWSSCEIAVFIPQSSSPIPCSKGAQKKCATSQRKRPLNALLDMESDEKDKQDKQKVEKTKGVEKKKELVAMKKKKKAKNHSLQAELK